MSEGLAFLFPGQGSQRVGMGRALAEAFPVARETFEEADAVLGEPLSQLCFGGPAETLVLTEYTQPAVLAVSVAALRVVRRELGWAADYVAGHSLGEYAALVAAGSLGFADALRAVRSRGRLMQSAVPVGTGAMAAIIGLALEDVDRLCHAAAGEQVVSPANLNGGGQVVVAGHREAVLRVMHAARDSGARAAVMLDVSAPFHCSLMAPAATGMAPVLGALPVMRAEIPWVSNVDAQAHSEPDEIRRLLLAQLTSPVRWEAVVRQLAGSSVGRALEIGPGKVLSGLIRRMAAGLHCEPVGEPEDVARIRQRVA